MSLAWVALALVPAVAHLAAPGPAVYFGSEGTAPTAAARRIVSSVFLEAGVPVTWVVPRPHLPPSPDAIRIDLVEDARDERFPTSLAVSYPGDCSAGITVFLDRVRALAGNPGRESALLGYVVAHEIAHLLQALNRHSSSGVMKARWTDADRAAIFRGQLAFARLDVLLMRRGLAGGRCRTSPSAGRPVKGLSEPGTAGRPE
jgi:hypothetical protein